MRTARLGTRWADATAGKALGVIEQLAGLLDDLDEAIAEVRGVQEEYEEWKDNLPENLQSSTLGEKLDAVCDLSIEDIASGLRTAIEEAQGTLEEADSIDLPLGFGRD